MKHLLLILASSILCVCVKTHFTSIFATCGVSNHVSVNFSGQVKQINLGNGTHLISGECGGKNYSIVKDGVELYIKLHGNKYQFSPSGIKFNGKPVNITEGTKKIVGDLRIEYGHSKWYRVQAKGMGSLSYNDGTVIIVMSAKYRKPLCGICGSISQNSTIY